MKVDAAERPVRFEPTLIQIEQMLRHNWKRMRLIVNPTENPKEVKIFLSVVEKRWFRSSTESLISFDFREGTDKLRLSTNVTYLDFFRDEFYPAPHLAIPYSRKEKTKVTFILKERAYLELLNHDGVEAFQFRLTDIAGRVDIDRFPEWF